MVSTYICTNDEIKQGRLNAVIYMEQVQITPYESEDEPSEAENKDEVRSFGDLDIKHTKQQKSQSLIFNLESLQKTQTAYSAGNLHSDTDSDILEK